ncbi:SDR family oxidoreductase [Streptosporangium sp. DT93]|uniref:SDR family oxidoreductase n=1 Tax=Streptosporangium sp. DT93 TaxID=3393428 RepID=UPI003CF5145A
MTTVAVVGIGVLAPGASDPQELWQVLTGERPRFRPPVRFALEPIYSPDTGAEDRTSGRAAGYLDTFTPHPALAAELERGLWEPSDTEAVWLRHALLQAMDGFTLRPGERTGCYVATWTGATQAAEDTVLTEVTARAMAERLTADPEARALREHRLRTLLRHRYRHAGRRPRMLLPDMLVRRAFGGLLADDTDWLTVSAACASSLYAVDVGARRLADGVCDVAFCGSVHGMNRLMAVTAAKFGGMSARGDVRVFDAEADGTIFSEAATMVALKRRERAEADGDAILALIPGIALGNDGRGRSIAAPNPSGVRRALRDAWAEAGVSERDVDWVIAHGSGTITGDEVEIGALAEAAGDGELWCTSNKSLLGHAAWAAGGISLIQAVKALEHGFIPAQRRFTVPNAALAETAVRVPDRPVAWPPDPERPRVAGVSGMGVGGANAHLLISDRLPSRQAERDPIPEPLVLTAWSVWLPGSPAADRVRSWLATGQDPPPRSFGEKYPPSHPAALRLPPVVTEVIDRGHRMALDVAHRFVTEHGEMWRDLRDRSGVVLGHHGPTRSWIDVTLRAGAADLEALAWDADEHAALEDFLREVRARQRITDETLAGSVANLAAARVANRWDLRGPALAVDTGATSARTAVEVALSLLRAGRLDLALVLALNESGTREAAYLTERDVARLAEGAFLLAFTRQRTAADHGWPVLARFAPGQALAELPAPDGYDYLGAQDAVALLRHVTRHEHGEPAVPEALVPEPATLGAASRVTPGQGSGREAGDAGEPAPARRWAVTLRRADAIPSGAPEPAVPDRAVVLVNTAELARALAPHVLAANAVLLSTDPATRCEPAVVIGRPADEGDLAPVLARQAGLDPDLRVFASVRRPVADWLTEDPTVTGLLELVVLVARHFGGRLAGGRFAVTILDPLIDLQPHPDGAQFTGFARSLAWEIPAGRVVALVTDATPERALDELSTELAAVRDTPVVYRRGGLRHTEVLSPAPLPLPRERPAVFGPDPVIVAVGGARGIGAAALEDLARRYGPTLWILGRGDPRATPPEILAAGDDERARLRPAFLARFLRSGVTPGELSRTFDRHWRARQTAATLRTLRALCGDDRVHYLTCDVTDPRAVHRAVALITARHDHIDLVLNSAFQHEPARCGNKTLDAFRRVLDTKAGAHRHLKAAFAATPVGLWCTFGSSIVLLGMAGETDYTAGSEYLAAAARYESRLLGRPTITVGWGLWEQTGSAADAQTRARLGQAGVTSGITDAQGCALLRAELDLPRPAEPAPLYLTGDDHDLAARRTPAVIAGPPAPALLCEPAHHDGRSARWTWSLHPRHDRYLLEHLIDGRPALPAMAIAAMAAHAAGTLLPHLTVIGLRDIRLHAFVWADPRTPGPTKYRLLAEAGEDRVRVRLLSDVVSAGRVLRRDRCHASLDVLLGAPPAPPRWDGSSLTGTSRQADPCCRAGAAIQLTGVFRNTFDIHATGDRAQARFHAVLSPSDTLSRAPLPVLLLDALGRLSCYPPAGPHEAGLHAPTGIDRVDLYTHGPDSGLTERYPTGIDLYGDLRSSRYTAVAPNGTVLARLTGLHRHSFGTVPILPLPGAAGT